MKYGKNILAMMVILTNLCCLSGWCFSAEEESSPMEMRAVWFSTAWLGDWPEIKDSIPENSSLDTLIGITVDQMHQKERLLEMLDSLKAAGCNTVMFQTVSFMDAMHKSKYLPWSRYLTGTEGQTPLFDPLAVAVEHCHEIGLEIHAWMNPYRIGFVDRKYCENHPMRLHPSWLQQYKGSYYWNPGLGEVRGFIALLAQELLDNYDIDGIHIDDYFYPHGLQRDADLWDDSAEYLAACKVLEQKTGDSCAEPTLDEWRFSNVDATVELLYNTVHEHLDSSGRKSRLFGVSPAGRLVNTLHLYADPRRWTGYVDYIVPQIYWSRNHRLKDARFDVQLQLWPEEITPGVQVYAGMAIYRYGDTRGRENFDDEEYRAQTALTRSQKGIGGQMWFSARGVLDHFDLIKSLYEDCEGSFQEKQATEESED